MIPTWVRLLEGSMQDFGSNGFLCFIKNVLTFWILFFLFTYGKKPRTHVSSLSWTNIDLFKISNSNNIHSIPLLFHYYLGKKGKTLTFCNGTCYSSNILLKSFNRNLFRPPFALTAITLRQFYEYHDDKYFWSMCYQCHSFE